MRARLTKDFTFEAAQTLPNAPEGHKCRGMHGHSFKIEVSVEGNVDPDIGWIYDHAEISDAMKPLLKILDHSYLNDIEGLENPTIEKMAEWFWNKLQSQCPGLCEIVVHETPTAQPAACIAAGSLQGTTPKAFGVDLIMAAGKPSLLEQPNVSARGRSRSRSLPCAGRLFGRLFPPPFVPAIAGDACSADNPPGRCA